MEARPLLRSVRSLSSSVSLTSIRAQSTTARTKRALKIAPHPSFVTVDGAGDHVIFNPPSSVPSVYHTPFKFLPKSDPRRQANLSHLIRNMTTTTSDLAPEINRPNFALPKHNVTKEQVEEMRALRAADPSRWSVVRLAAKFNCSNYFVMMCCRSSAEHRASEKTRLEAIKSRWGPIRTKAREERQKRKVLLSKGQL
ncbi:mitochondrial ribosomal protein subunit L20-domain-containing protein [Xylariales sp. PMI_506]|nr:mitochondrial ribosomal protein subunit L20-domain-containing protein [Xylariales sp. PMI_506]